MHHRKEIRILRHFGGHHILMEVHHSNMVATNCGSRVGSLLVSRLEYTIYAQLWLVDE